MQLIDVLREKSICAATITLWRSERLALASEITLINLNTPELMLSL
jgi:hypothetical protein